MSKTVTYTIASREDAQVLADRILRAPLARPVRVTADFADKRTIPQNDHIHPVVRGIAAHMVANAPDGSPMLQWREEDWRHILLATYRGQEVVQNPFADGVVVINRLNGSSKLSKAEAADFLDWLYSVGIEKGVEFEK